MPRSLTCHYTNSTRTDIIPVYETDNTGDIKNRISGTGKYPPLVFFPASLDFSKENTEVLDLGALFGDKSPETASERLPALYSIVKTTYPLSLATFLEDWVFYELYVHFKNPDMSTAVAGNYLLLLKTILSMEYLKSFDSPLLDPVTKHRLNRRTFLDRLTKEWYTTRLSTFLSQTTTIQESNTRSAATGVLFEETVPLPVSDVEEIGKIIILDIPTTTLTTGVVFDRLVLNDELCVAQYKNFYKCFAPQANDPASFTEKVPDFYTTSVYTLDGKLTVYVQNTSE